MNINQVQDARVKQLAQTLKNNGLAASDTQAIQMAQNMTQTETKVIKQASDNKSSMVKNYELKEEPAPEAIKESEPIKEQPWENEVNAQEAPAPQQAPVPQFENQALNEAITNVQDKFEQPTANNDISNMSVSEAAETPEMPVQEEPVEEPVQEAPETPTQAPIQEAPASSIVENPLPTEHQNTETTPEMPTQEQFTAAPAPVQEAPEAPSAPTEPEQMPIEPVQEMPAEDDQPETTQEVTTAPEEKEEKDLSKFEESRVSLHDVFNFNK